MPTTTKKPTGKAKKGTPLGPRVTVAVAKNKQGVQTYALMLKSTAEYFGFSAVPSAGKKDKDGIFRPVRGAKGSGSIKVPVSSSATKSKTASTGTKKYKSIPMPSGATIPQIQAFLQKASKNKPDSFVTRDGRTYPVTAAKGGTKK